MVILHQSSEIPVPLKAGRNAVLRFNTLLNLTHHSLHCTGSQTLLYASSDWTTYCCCRHYMPYDNVANLVTELKMNMKKTKIPCSCGTLRTTTVRILHQVSFRACVQVSGCLKVTCRFVLWFQVLSKSPANLFRGLSSSKIWLFYHSNRIASGVHHYNCRCFQKHLRLRLHSQRIHSNAPWGTGSVWKYLELLLGGIGVLGSIGCSFRISSHFAYVASQPSLLDS